MWARTADMVLVIFSQWMGELENENCFRFRNFWFSAHHEKNTYIICDEFRFCFFFHMCAHWFTDAQIMRSHRLVYVFIHLLSQFRKCGVNSWLRSCMLRANMKYRKNSSSIKMMFFGASRLIYSHTRLNMNFSVWLVTIFFSWYLWVESFQPNGWNCLSAWCMWLGFYSAIARIGLKPNFMAVLIN